MTAPLVDKGIDKDELNDRPERTGGRKKWVLLGVGVVVVGGLTATALTVIGGDSTPGSSAETTAPAGDGDGTEQGGEAAGPLTFRRYVAEKIPDDFVVTYVSDPQSNFGGPGVDVAPMSEQSTLLLVGADGTYEEGPWLGVSVQLLDRFERRNFQPSNYVDMTTAKDVTIGGLKGVVSKNFDGSTGVVFGPVNDGFAVTVSGRGIPENQLVEIANELTLEEDEDKAMARPVLAELPAGLELTVLADYSVPSWGGFGGFTPPLLFGSPLTASINYSTKDDFSDYITVSSEKLDAAFDADALIRFIIDDVKDVKVGDIDAVTGTGPDMMGGSEIVAWVQDGYFIAVTGSVDVEELVTVAQSVAEGSEEKWEELRREGERNSGGFQPRSVDSWLVDSGDLSTSLTWVIEAGFEDDDVDGDLLLCSSAMSGDGSTSSSGCSQNLPQVPTPWITEGPDISFNVSAPSYVAFVGNDVVGARLRLVAADGTIVVERPLHVVRSDWPFQMAAIAVEAAGTVELVGSDGAVLDSATVDADDVPDPEDLDITIDTAVPTTIAVGG
jgi:hypothetical protein